MPLPRIAVVFTGGTIAMRSSGAGNVPVLRGDELLSTVPGLGEVADVEPIDWGLVPASHLSFEQVLDIGRILARELARPAIDGAVVVQGTDVIEETAFAWDLLPLPAKPVVVVGAMRSASQDGYDGPANLRNAIAAAADARLAAQGVVVAMGGELHAADDVRKTHTHALDTFRSPNAGRLGVVTDAVIALERERIPVRLARFPEAAALPVPMLTVVLDEAPVLSGDPAGVVVAAAGGGNTPPAYLELAREFLPCGGRANARHFQSIDVASSVASERHLVCLDPQTSGGLLLAVDLDAADDISARLDAAGRPGWRIGTVVAGSAAARVRLT